jgi:transaldolase/glucose-6-phosphate isomerase
MTKLHELHDRGQAIWLDYIRRSFIVSGELKNLVGQGLRGVTSNPSIFEKAIAGSADYDEDLKPLVREDKSVEEIYEVLAIDDIQRAADILRPIYDQSGGDDGYVSLEVSPSLARDTQGTLAEARRLFAALGRPNVMIKVPATREGIPAVELLIGEGINVNVTLIFSLTQYEAVAEVYLAGLEKLAAAGGDLSKVGSVASFFISRVDTAVDRALEGTRDVSGLQGKIAIASAKVAYARFREIFSGERWKSLVHRGARVQRPLWASTGTKNPLYPDTLYVDSLIGADTVNTVPPATLQAFLEHGQVAPTLESGLEDARADLDRLAEMGIDLSAMTEKLQEEGVAAFAESFEVLMAGIAEKREKLLTGQVFLSANLGSSQAGVDAALVDMKSRRVINRIWNQDHTVWNPEPREISNRLGWLHIAEVMRENLDRMQSLTEEVKADGYTQAVLLGMGGSSMAPEVFQKTFGRQRNNEKDQASLELAVLDSTDPGAVSALAERLNPAKTLFIVSTKSGGTIETLSFFKFFYNRVAEDVGAEQAGAHFVAITDPGSKLADLAEQYHFRTAILNDPNIGGRYSALSYFGLVPAALIGVDVETLLHRAMTMVCNCEGCNCPIGGDNNSGRLGAVMGELAKAGRDKLTLITSPAIAGFGDWVEQLVAESTGKDAKGILPVVNEPLGLPEAYGSDRLFVYLKLKDDETHDTTVKALEEAGHPVVRLLLDDPYDLGGQFFLWEMATAVAGSRIGINPFDQPNVEAAKVLARQMVAAYQKEGKLPELLPVLQSNDIAVYGDVKAGDPGEALNAFLERAQPDAYVALQAYVQPSAETDAAIRVLRTKLRDRSKLATTFGYGPRFLHSTGQLHKGDAGRGLFIQITADTPLDIPIPDEPGSEVSSITFGALKMAQALGDRQALLDAGRQVIRFHLGPDVIGGLQQLEKALS